MVTSVLSHFAVSTPKISVIHTLIVMVNVAPLYFPLLFIRYPCTCDATSKLVVEEEWACGVAHCTVFRLDP